MSYRERIRQRLLAYMKNKITSMAHVSRETGVSHLTLTKFLEERVKTHMETVFKLEVWLDKKEKE